jgi:hypothetical protein
VARALRCTWRITDATFAHLRGIHKLNMSRCEQAGITAAAFVHLCGIRVLYMSASDKYARRARARRLHVVF